MNQIAVSVIVSIYNKEDYLIECINSIINQSFKNIEIIAINDGSIDSSYDILSEIAKKDSRVKVIDKPNEGAGKTKNLGLENAIGDFIIFVDADDKIPFRWIEELYQEAIGDELDIAVGNILWWYPENEKRNRILNKDLHQNVTTGEEFYSIAIENKSMTLVAVDKIYRRNFLNKYVIRFGEDSKLDDWVFVIPSVLYASKIKYVGKSAYFYRQNISSSITGTISNQLVESYFYEANKLEKFIESLDEKKKVSILKYQLLRQYFVLQTIALMNFRYTNNILNRINFKYCPSVSAILISKSRLKDKLMLLLFRTSPKGYFHIYRVYRTIKEKIGLYNYE